MSKLQATYYCVPEECNCPYFENGWCKLDKPYEECDDYANIVEESEE